MKIELNDRQYSALLQLLNRVQIAGNEVPVFVELITALNQGAMMSSIPQSPIGNVREEHLQPKTEVMKKSDMRKIKKIIEEVK